MSVPIILVVMTVGLHLHLCATEKEPIRGKEAFKRLATDLLRGHEAAVKLKLGVLGVNSAGGGKSAEQMTAATKLAKAEIEQAFSGLGQVEIIARDQLADLEIERGFQNKKVEIEGVDALVRGTLFYKGRSVSVHFELVFLDGKTQSGSAELDPEYLGLPRLAPEETELPPALASVRIADQTLFDIKVAEVKIHGIKARLGVPTNGMSAEDAAALRSTLDKAMNTRLTEQKVGAEKVIGELNKLTLLDAVIVNGAFKERRSEILLKGAEEGLDTELQRKLLGKLEDLYYRSTKTGLKLTVDSIIGLGRDSGKL